MVEMFGIEGEIILWAANFGLLIGIVWSLRTIIKIQRKIANKMHVKSVEKATPKKKK